MSVKSNQPNSSPSADTLEWKKSFSVLYKERLENYLGILQREPAGSKHSVLARAKNGEIDHEAIKSLCRSAESKSGDADFHMLVLIRLLHMDIPRQSRVAIINSLVDFPFWPHNADDGQDMKKIVFWSENHIFMMLSSAFLLRQAVRKENAGGKESFKLRSSGDLEVGLLRAYLNAHVEFRGVFEVLSFVYLPFTLNALLNLVDFSADDGIKQSAERLCDIIVEQIMRVTTSSGVFSLSASARTYPRFRERTWGHSLNPFIYLVTGIKLEEPASTALGDALATTNWVPKESALEAFQWNDFCRIQMNPSVPEIRALLDYKNTGIEESKCTPLYWSAGLLVHPEFATETRKYIDEYKLSDNVHLWPLAYFTSVRSVASYSRSLANWTRGQSYVSITLNVFKKDNLCMTSFERYNGGTCSYQQLPWMANVSGVPVWTQSGKGSENIGGFDVTNTHAPHISQNGPVLVAAYVT